MSDGASIPQADVVILTAIPLEYEAVRKVDAGALPGSSWENVESPTRLPVSFRTFLGRGSRQLRVLVARAADMGAVAATNALLPIVEAADPACIAMAGVCAGRPGKTNLGDVIAAERLFFHDTGKQLPDRVQQDLNTYRIPGHWKTALEDFKFLDRFREEAWFKARPIPLEWQENWLLAKLHEGVAKPGSLPECDVACPQWEEVVEALWKAGALKKKQLVLTSQGRERIEGVLAKYRDRLPDLSPTGKHLPFRVHVAPMGSGNKIIEDVEYWGFVSEHMRKTLGLEMEAAALGEIAHAWRSRRDRPSRPLDALVMKGVMDFGNHGRDDHFKDFAARVSAECLLAFLREHFDPEVIPGVDDLLVPGTEPLPPKPSPSKLLTARYEVVKFEQAARARTSSPSSTAGATTGLRSPCDSCTRRVGRARRGSASSGCGNGAPRAGPPASSCPPQAKIGSSDSTRSADRLRSCSTTPRAGRGSAPSCCEPSATTSRPAPALSAGCASSCWLATRAIGGSRCWNATPRSATGCAPRRRRC